MIGLKYFAFRMGVLLLTLHFLVLIITVAIVDGFAS